MRYLFRYIRPYRVFILLTFLLKFVSSVVELFLPRLMAYIIDVAVPAARAAIDAGGSIREGYLDILGCGGVMLACALVALFGNMLANGMAAKSSAEITRNIRRDLFRKTAELAPADVDRLTTPSLISRLTSDSYYINELLGMTQRMGVRAPILLFGGLLLTLSLDGYLTLVLAAALPLIFLTVTVITKRSIPIYREEQEDLDTLTRIVRENASGVRVIRALSKTEHEEARFCRASEALSAKEKQAGRLMSLSSPITSLILNLGFCAVLLVGARRVSAGETEPGAVLAFLTYFTLILNATIGISRIFVRWSRGFASAARIREVLTTEQALPISEREPAGTDAHILFDDVTFSYNGVEPNLSHVSFSLGRGQSLGIIGATGSGKSTLLALLERFYDPDEGRICIDGVDIRSLSREELASKFGAVFQNDFILGTDVGENVSFFRDVGEEAVSRALRDAQAEDFVMADPEGLRRPVTARGSNLSGGQKQRLLVARALADDPEILLLDDASSALDYATDVRMRRAIRASHGNTTTVIVAQRVSTVRSCDLILVLDDGAVVGRGSHSELLATCPIYRSIAEVQMGGEGDA